MMYTKNHLWVWGVILVMTACSPKITSKISKSYVPLDSRVEVLVLDLQTPAPDNADHIGSVHIGDTGFSTDCSWETVIELAKAEARKAGGNAIKITKHQPPSFYGSACHRITATVLRIENAAEIAAAVKADDVAANWDYALVHIYRGSSAGTLVGYDVHLGSEVLCRATSEWKTTIQVRNFGHDTLWASTESRAEIPVNFEPGREYYIRCGIKLGFFVGHPTLTLADKNIGKSEFEAIRMKNDTQPDRLWRLALNAGYSCRLAPLYDGLNSWQKEHVKKLRHGFNISADASYFFTEMFGAGVKYDLHKASNLSDYAEDRISILYVAPAVAVRLFNQAKTSCWFMSASVGYMGFKDSGRSSTIKTKGSTMGLSTDIGYDVAISKKWSVGIQLSTLAGVLTKVEFYPSYGASEKVKLEKDMYEGLGRANISIGLRCNL